ncbi:translation initiation factor IF3-1, mitochondrial-like [Zingiber officinale]|uniref:translation initiation factor IF3-1, mitochondrial-like n=1 Tax=Zingiber officinale TaxID=94328 RepID=UPI001C4D0816|nr:translation initiation factor IF3-1, mitochondrial-like [Zingiber officinale]
MFPSLASRRVGAPDKIWMSKRILFSQCYGLPGQTGSGFSAGRSVLDQPQCDPDPICLQAHPRWYSHISSASRALLDGHNRQLRFVVLKHPFRPCSAISPSSNFMYTSERTFAAPVQFKPKDKPSSDSHAGPRINESITASFIRLVSDDGHGIVTRREALDRAKKLNLDLVEVQGNADPPVCKIMDFHKERYKREVKEKERAKTKSSVTLRKGENKEVRFKGKTELKDLKIKADSVIRLMERGYRVKCTAVSTGKEGEDLDELLSRLLPLIEDVANVESGPHVVSGQAYVIVRHMKFCTKKSGKKLSEVVDAVSKGLPGTVSRTDAVASNASQDGEAVLSEEKWETIDSLPETEDEALAETINTNNATSHSHSMQKNISGIFHQKDPFPPGASGFTAQGAGQGSSRFALGMSKEPSVAENNRYAGFTAQGAGQGSSRSALGMSNEPSVAENNRYAKRTEVMDQFQHQNVMNRSNAAPYPRAPRYDVKVQQEPIRRGQVHQFDPNQGPLRATKAPDSGDHHRFGVNTSKPCDGDSHRPPNYGNFTTQKAVPHSQHRNSDETLQKQRTVTPIFGNLGTTKSPDSGDHHRFGGGNVSKPNDGGSHRPNYGNFTTQKATPHSQHRNSDEKLEKQRTVTPIFGNFLSKKPAGAASDQNLGDDSAPDKSSYSPVTSKYGIFSASKVASPRN